MHSSTNFYVCPQLNSPLFFGSFSSDMLIIFDDDVVQSFQMKVATSDLLPATSV